VKRTILGFKDAYDATLKSKKQHLNEDAQNGAMMMKKLTAKFRQVNMKSPVKFTSLENTSLQQTLASLRRLEGNKSFN